MFDFSESFIRFFIFWGGLSFFLLIEFLIPYRASSVSKVKRWINNLALTLFNSILLNLTFSTAIVLTATYVQTHRLGVLNLIQGPTWLKLIVTILFMDFMLYVWHLLNHEMPLLSRFHRVHHSDLNMDVSSATRFHIGELAISAAIKICIIFFLGARAMDVMIFETVLVLCVQFHHSSLKVAGWFETIFWVLFVPPSMHRIHHSVISKERNTNYGAIFSLWDRFLGTLLKKVDQTKIHIGLRAYQNPDRLNFHRLLLMPFTKSLR